MDQKQQINQKRGKNSVSNFFFHHYFRLCDDYEQIAEKALTTPSNTEHLMELKAYIEKVESDIIFTMEKRLMESKDRLTFLSDFAQFSPAEMRLNASVFKWHGRMPTIFEEHKMIVSDRRTQYEEALKVCCLSFVCLFFKGIYILMFWWLYLPERKTYKPCAPN